MNLQQVPPPNSITADAYVPGRFHNSFECELRRQIAFEVGNNPPDVLKLSMERKFGLAPLAFTWTERRFLQDEADRSSYGQEQHAV